MKKILTSIVTVMVLLGGVTPALHAQGKIAIIDLKRTFDSYWKTKQADATLKDRAADFDKSRRSMVEDYQKGGEEYKKLADSSSDAAVSADEREKRRKQAEAKLLELKEIENSINQFDRQAKTTLGEQQRRMRDNVLKEIRDVINTKAKAGSYSMVLDSTGESITQTPIVLYNIGGNDLTDDVIATINATAPANLPKTEAKEAKPAEPAKPEKK